jgi:hypothetical protein
MSKLPRTHVHGTATPVTVTRMPLEALRNDELAPLIARAQWLDGLDHLLRLGLPVNVAPHCRLANVVQDKLVFQVSSPVWKNKLRLYSDTLLGAAAAAGLSVRTLVIKVVAEAPIIPDRPLGKPLSQKVRDSLRTTAQSVEDPELRAQLLTLANLS